MNVRNIEFKAAISDLEALEEKLLTLQPDFRGIDHQIDTYFNAAAGRLKLREGTIENALIQYYRNDSAELKLSEIVLYRHQPDEALKQILTSQFGIKAVVDKKRKIYFIGNVKFHFDRVEKLGTFIEVEAISEEGRFTLEELEEQCNRYFRFFELEKNSLVDRSYSDLVKNIQ